MTDKPNHAQLWPFTLHDQQKLLEPEDFPSLQQAINRATGALWSSRPWHITGPDGRPAASRRRAETRGSGGLI